MIDENSQTIHGSLISIDGVGILIVGESGVGKSQLCVDALRRGHKLVADDSVELTASCEHLFGKAPNATAHLLELRGVGIVDVRREFGPAAFLEKSTVDVCVEIIGDEADASIISGRKPDVIGKFPNTKIGFLRMTAAEANVEFLEQTAKQITQVHAAIATPK